MKDIQELYTREGHKIFPPVSKFAGLLSQKYRARGLKRILKAHFNKEIISNLKTPTLITAYNLKDTKLHLFNSETAKDKKHNFKVRHVARATSAAPTFFSAARIKSLTRKKYTFIDGGVVANNPTYHAYKLAHNELWKGQKLHIISLGTGAARLPDLLKRAGSGKLGWAPDIVGVLMKSLADQVEDVMIEVAKEKKNKTLYTRLQFKLPRRNAEMDDVRRKNIRALKRYVKKKIGSKKVQIIKYALLNSRPQQD
jgi:patatin-like phospholipase/acyl hydrolase